VQITCCSTASPSRSTDERGTSSAPFHQQDPGVRDRVGNRAARHEEDRVIYINTDFGTDMLRFYKTAVASRRRRDRRSAVQRQSTELPGRVTRALAAKPESCCSSDSPRRRHHRARVAVARRTKRSRSTTRSHPDSSTAWREVRRTSSAWTTRSGGPHVEAFNKSFEEKFKADTKDRACTRVRALMVMALAMNIAPDLAARRSRTRWPRARFGRHAVGTGRRVQEGARLIKAGKRSSISARPARSSSTPTAT